MARKPQRKQGQHVSGAHGPAIRSMTGFGRATVNQGTRRFTAEVRSVNGRFLKVTVKVPAGYGALEERIKTQLDAHGLKRGSVDVALFFDSAEEGGRYSINAEVVTRYAQEARAISKRLGVKDELPIHALLALPGTVKRADDEEDLSKVWAHCARALDGAYEHLDRMRVAEGASLAGDIRARIQEMREHQVALAASAPLAQEKNIARFKERVGRLLEKAGVAQTLSNEAVEREIVLAADRMDISEELARLGSHFEQMETALSEGGEAGKRLDFITQELLRETNTVGSKANDQEITHRVVAMKGLIEKIREQVQNLE